MAWRISSIFQCTEVAADPISTTLAVVMGKGGQGILVGAIDSGIDGRSLRRWMAGAI
jgi:hypothetical protein